MTAKELLAELKAMAHDPVDETRTCDNFKAGDPERPLHRVALAMFATPDVIRAAAADGADFLLVHEPTFYDHMDRPNDNPLVQEKQALLEKSGLTLARFHDYAHSMLPDLICEGELHDMGLPGRFVRGDYWAVNGFVLEQPMTARELAAHMEKTLGLHHVRIAGSADTPGTRLACCFGTPGHTAEMLAENDFLLTGEICEWGLGEMARDYAQLGHNKAILVMTHEGSERAGMKLLADKLRVLHPEIEFTYYESGEIYTYTD